MKLFLGLLLVFSSLLNAAEIGLGTYGNWCGLEHPSDPKTAADPVDVLDGACQRHDQCYVAKGAFSCECDAVFQQEISAGLKSNVFQSEAKHFARSAHHYFKGSPCKGTPKSKLAPTRVIQKLFDGGKNIVEKIVPGEKAVNKDTVVESQPNVQSEPESTVDTPTAPSNDSIQNDNATK